MFFGGGQNLVGGHHHAHVNDFVVVATQHHTHNVFANVVHVAFDGSQQNTPSGSGAAVFFFFDERSEIGYCFFHHPCRFYDLRQKHFAFAKQVAHHVHAVHKWAFDYVQRLVGGGAGFFGVLVNKLSNALNQRVFEAFAHGLVAPSIVYYLFFTF